MAKELEAEDIELKDYIFTPKEITVDGNSVIDYTDVENDKVFLCNRKDILDKPRPSWIPELDEKGLALDKFLPVCVKDFSDGNYFVQSKVDTGTRDANGKTVYKNKIYKMSSDVLAATVDYYLKRKRAELKREGSSEKVSLPRGMNSMPAKRYNEISKLCLLCNVPSLKYKNVDKSITDKAFEMKGKTPGKLYHIQNEVVFLEQWQPLLENIKGKRLDMNYQKQDYIDSYSKAVETAYGDKNTFNNLYNDYGVKIKKQNGSNFSKAEIDRLSETIEKVFKHYGNLSILASDYGLKVSYADNCMQFASKSIGLFSPFRNVIGVSFFNEEKQESVAGINHTADVTFSHEIAHWLDNQKGKESHSFFASDKYGTLENQIAEKFKNEIKLRKKSNKSAAKIGKTDEIHLGEYWFRTCECFARAMEQYYALQQGIDLSEEISYARKDNFETDFVPLIEQLMEENKKLFSLSIETNQNVIEKKQELNKEKENKLMEETKEIKEMTQAEKDSKILLETYGNKKAVDAACKKASVSDFVCTDGSRYLMTGIFYEKGFAIATDGRMFIKLKKDYPAEWEGKIVDPNTLKVIEGTFPAYEKVFPNKDRLVDRTSRLAHISNYLSEATAAIAISEKTKRTERIVPVMFENTFVNPRQLQLALSFARDKGFNKVFQEDNYKKEVIEYENNPEIPLSKTIEFDAPDGSSILIMPVREPEGAYIDKDGILKNYEEDIYIKTKLLGKDDELCKNIIKTLIKDTVFADLDVDSIYKRNLDEAFSKQNPDIFPKNKKDCQVLATVTAYADVIGENIDKKDFIFEEGQSTATLQQFFCNLWLERFKDYAAHPEHVFITEKSLTPEYTIDFAKQKNIIKEKELGFEELVTDTIEAGLKTEVNNESKKYSFFVKDTAEFEQFADFESITNLSAEEAVKTFIEQKNKDLSAGIGINIPGDFIFDDPEGNGAIVLQANDGKVSFYMGDNFIKELKENNEHAQNIIAAFKALDEVVKNSEINRDGLYVEPAFLYEKEKELLSNNSEITIFDVEEEKRTVFIKDFCKDVQNPSFSKLSDVEKLAVILDMSKNVNWCGEYQDETGKKDIYTVPLYFVKGRIERKGWDNEYSYFDLNKEGQKKHYDEVIKEFLTEQSVNKITTVEIKPVTLEDILGVMEMVPEATTDGKFKVFDQQRNEYIDNTENDLASDDDNNWTFNNAAEIFEHLDVYINDYYINDMINQLEAAGAGPASSESLEDLCLLYKRELEKGNTQLEAGELNLAMGIVNPDSVIMPVLEQKHSINKETSLSDEKELSVNFMIFRLNNEQLAELKEHLSLNGYKVEWEPVEDSKFTNYDIDFASFKIDYDSASYVRPILEDRNIDYHTNMGLTALGFDGKWVDDPLNVEIVSEKDFKQIQEEKEKKLIEKKLPYIKIGEHNESSYDNYIEGGTVLSFPEADAILPELNEKWGGGHYKTDFTMFFPEEDISYAPYRYEIGDNRPLGLLSDNLHMHCSHLEVLETFESNWKKVYAPSVTEEQEKALKEIIKPVQELLETSYKQRFTELEKTMEENKKLNTSFIVEHGKIIKSEEEVKAVQTHIKNIFSSSLEMAAKNTTDYIEKLYDSLEDNQYEDLNRYSFHLIANMIEDVKYGESRMAGADYKKMNSFNLDVWRKSLEGLDDNSELMYKAQVVSEQYLEDLELVRKNELLKEGDKVTVSLKTLYEHIEEKEGSFFFNDRNCVKTLYGDTIEISDGSEGPDSSYYDLYAKDGTLLCCDGETLIYSGIEEKTGLHTFTNTNNESQYLITLGNEELGIAAPGISFETQRMKDGVEYNTLPGTSLSNFDHDKFREIYSESYNRYYNAEDKETRAEQSENMRRFDFLMKYNKNFKEAVQVLVSERKDPYSSDRECAAVVDSLRKLGIDLTLSTMELADVICQEGYEQSASGFMTSFSFSEIAELADRNEDWVRDNLKEICEALATHNDELLLDFNETEALSEPGELTLNFCSVGEDYNELFKKDDSDRWVRKTDEELRMEDFEDGGMSEAAMEAEIENDIDEKPVWIINGEQFTEKIIEEALHNDLAELFEQYDSGETEKNLTLVGVKMYRDPAKDGKISLLVEFDSKNPENRWREDSLFNALNEEGIEFNGMKVDFNPITKEKSGTIEQYLKQLEGFGNEEEVIKENARKLEEKEIENKLNDISNSLSEIDSDEQRILPFSIFENKEKGRVNIKFDTAKINRDIIKELKAHGWKYAASTKQWYPVGNAVKTASDFANRLQEKYSETRNSNMEKPMDLGLEQSPYDGIRFFDRNYNESEDFAKFFNSNIYLFKKGKESAITEEDAATILKAIGYEKDGIVEQRKLRVGLDNKDKIVILTSENGNVKTEKIELSDILEFAKNKAEERVIESKQMFQNYLGKEPVVKKDLQDIFISLYETCVTQSEEIDSKMKLLYDSFIGKKHEQVKEAVLYQRNSYRGWEISTDKDFKKSVYCRPFEQTDRSGYILMAGKEGKDGFWQEKFVREILKSNNWSERDALIETLTTLASDKETCTSLGIKEPQSLNGFFSSLDKIIHVENDTDIKNELMKSLLGPYEAHKVSKESTKELSVGDKLGEDTVSDLFWISDGVCQATLSREVNGVGSAQNYFVIDNSIINQLDEELKELVVSFDSKSVIENKSYEPYILKELIEKGLMPPRDDEFIQQLDEYISVHPLKYEKLKPVDYLNFERKLQEIEEVDKAFNKTPFELGQQLIALVDESDRERLNIWLRKQGCDSREHMAEVFASWLKEEPEQKKDVNRKKENSYPPRGEQ